jgi:hypothetical protein
VAGGAVLGEDWADRLCELVGGLLLRGRGGGERKQDCAGCQADANFRENHCGIYFINYAPEYSERLRARP